MPAAPLPLTGGRRCGGPGQGAGAVEVAATSTPVGGMAVGLTKGGRRGGGGGADFSGRHGGGPGQSHGQPR